LSVFGFKMIICVQFELHRLVEVQPRTDMWADTEKIENTVIVKNKFRNIT